MTLREHLEVLLNPLLEDGNCFLIDIVIKPSKVSQKITILVDSDEGITIQQCSVISRKLGRQLEELELISEAYTLEVSSPGLDQPLVLPRQYQKNVGRNLRLTLKNGEVMSGTLISAGDEEITIKLPLPKKKTKTPIDESTLLRLIRLEDISKALIEISFK